MLRKSDVYSMGFERGQSIAKHVPWIEKGPIEDTNAAREVGVVEVESLADAEMLFYHWASESESINRDYSPFEWTAKELNDLNEKVEWDVWDVYNEAIQEGFKKVWTDAEKTYRSRGYL